MMYAENDERVLNVTTGQWVALSDDTFCIVDVPAPVFSAGEKILVRTTGRPSIAATVLVCARQGANTDHTVVVTKTQDLRYGLVTPSQKSDIAWGRVAKSLIGCFAAGLNSLGPDAEGGK